MKILKMATCPILVFLLLIPAVSEGKRVKTKDLESGKEGRTKVRIVQNNLDLSGYGVIDEDLRVDLQSRLKNMIQEHNRKYSPGRKSKVKNIRFGSSSGDPRNSKVTVENFNYLDLGGYDFITPVDQKQLETRLDEMIEQHNLYARGKLKRSGSIRYHRR